MLHNQKRIRSQVAICVQEAPVADIILGAVELNSYKLQNAPSKIILTCYATYRKCLIDRNIETDNLKESRTKNYFCHFVSH